jgi:hypothetical protein
VGLTAALRAVASSLGFRSRTARKASTYLDLASSVDMPLLRLYAALYPSRQPRS